MKCLVVDDNAMVRKDLEKRIADFPALELAGSCENASEAISILMKEQIDLLFLDVEMPGLSGFQLLNTLPAGKPFIILITSKKEYASDAFEYEVADFLVKPFSDERFLKAVLKVTRLLESKFDGVERDSIFVRVNSMLEKIELKEIQYVEALADYVQIQCLTKKYVVHSTMKNMESSLPSSKFFRVHNSFIIHLDKITRIEDNSVIISDKVIPISRAKVKMLMEKLNLLKSE